MPCTQYNVKSTYTLGPCRLAWWAENLTVCFYFLKRGAFISAAETGRQARDRKCLEHRPHLAPHLQICTHQLEPACEAQWYNVRGMARAEVRGVNTLCNLTFFSAGWQKIVAQIRGVFRKKLFTTPFGSKIWPQNTSSHPIFVFTPSPRAPVCGALRDYCGASIY